MTPEQAEVGEVIKLLEDFLISEVYSRGYLVRNTLEPVILGFLCACWAQENDTVTKMVQFGHDTVRRLKPQLLAKHNNTLH